MKQISILPVTRDLKSSGQNVYGLDVAAGTVATVGDAQVMFPPGCKRIAFQARQCGDIYAELLTNDNHVSGAGADALQAINSALGKLQAAA